MFIDTHCHLADSRFASDRDSVFTRSKLARVNRWIIPTAQTHEWHTLQQLAQKHDGVYPAYAIHPWFCEQFNDTSIKALAQYLKHAIAVGECGLDFSNNQPSKTLQLQCLHAHFTLAETYQLPLVLHAHKSLDTLSRELKSRPQLRGVVHAFAGSKQQAELFIKQGFYLGIGGRITYPQAKKLRLIVRNMPLEYLLLETDAPDQPPYLHQGERNEPALLIEIAKEIATLRGMSIDSLIQYCNNNAQRLFAL